MLKYFLPLSALYLLPVVSFAAEVEEKTVNPLLVLVGNMANVLKVLIPFVFGLGLLFFFWGVAIYVFQAGNEDAKKEAKRIMLGGIIALFVMSAIWGIVKFMADVVGIGVGGNFNPPSINLPDYSGGADNS